MQHRSKLRPDPEEPWPLPREMLAPHILVEEDCLHSILLIDLHAEPALLQALLDAVLDDAQLLQALLDAVLDDANGT